MAERKNYRIFAVGIVVWANMLDSFSYVASDLLTYIGGKDTVFNSI